MVVIDDEGSPHEFRWSCKIRHLTTYDVSVYHGDQGMGAEMEIVVLQQTAAGDGDGELAVL